MKTMSNIVKYIVVLLSLIFAMIFISKLVTQSIGPNWDIAGMVIILMITLLLMFGRG
jgi:NAD/NADP transhydrogenase beta subunit